MVIKNIVMGINISDLFEDNFVDDKGNLDLKDIQEFFGELCKVLEKYNYKEQEEFIRVAKEQLNNHLSNIK